MNMQMLIIQDPVSVDVVTSSLKDYETPICIPGLHNDAFTA